MTVLQFIIFYSGKLGSPIMLSRTSRIEPSHQAKRVVALVAKEKKNMHFRTFQSGGIFITIVNVVQIIPFRQSNDKSFTCRSKE